MNEIMRGRQQADQRSHPKGTENHKQMENVYNDTAVAEREAVKTQEDSI